VFELTDEQHREMAAALHELKGMVIVSGYPSPLYDEIFEGWTCRVKRAFADGGAERVEALWLSPRTVAALGHGPLFERRSA
jgi:DNA adenine methylase